MRRTLRRQHILVKEYSDPGAHRLFDVLARIEYEPSQRAVVVIEEDRYRIRYLPIDDS
jgi:hypothetical protein